MKNITFTLWSITMCAVFISGCTLANQSSSTRAAQAVVSGNEKNDDAPLAAGHSSHGEVFNEGPRQAAYFFPGNGAVHWPVTTKNAEAQKFFDQGLGQLHGFWYFEAERSFRQAATIDPDCAMAYWGMAQVNFKNEKRARGFIAEAMKRRSTTKPIERLHIEACSAYYLETDKTKNKARRAAYLSAFTNILKKYPDDIETAAFAVRYRWEFRSDVKLSDDDYAANNTLLDSIFARNVAHPAHHFRIHLWDEKDAKNALTSAAACGQAAPGIAHMWHMPGHIYTKLNRFDDAVWQQEASARVDHAHMMRDGVLPDQIHNYAHNNEWLCRDLIIIGRMSDALALAHNMATLPRHPKYNTLSKGSGKYAIERLYDIHYQFELWDAMLVWTDQLVIDPAVDEQGKLDLLRARGVAFAHLQKTPQLNDIIADLDKRIPDLEKRQKEAGRIAFERVEKNGADIPAKSDKDDKNSTDSTNDKEEDKKESAKEDEEKDDKKTDGKKKDAPAVKKSPAELAQDKATKEFDKRVKTAKTAIAELRALHSLAAGPSPEVKKLLAACEKDVPPLRLARYHLLAGDHDQAIAFARKAVAEKNGEHSVLPLALLTHVLFVSDKKDEARTTFAKLRDLSDQAEISAPPLARLALIAKANDAPADWRTPTKAKTDVGVRPALDTLGPFRWQPTPALPWSLPDADGKQHQLSDFRGKPVVVIFYLGYGCVHCTEQLAAFWPMAEAYKEAGIELIGISTDNITDLKLALAPAKAATKAGTKITDHFPFPLVADPDKSIFKTYRAFDDFENIPLHGTFLIDAEGQVRWRDISFEPFMDASFLLKEAKRLLAIPTVL